MSKVLPKAVVSLPFLGVLLDRLLVQPAVQLPRLPPSSPIQTESSAPAGTTTVETTIVVVQSSSAAATAESTAAETTEGASESVSTDAATVRDASSQHECDFLLIYC